MARRVLIGGAEFLVEATEQDGQWVAVARTARGERHGPSRTGATEDGAITRMLDWLEWQREHSIALEALQEAERAYQRVAAGSAFISRAEEPSLGELQKEALNRLEEARLRLDEVRQRKPE